MTKTWSFDSEETQSYTRVRQDFISKFLDSIKDQVSLQTTIDVGCGVGYFAKFLSERGLRVVAMDGRDENAREGRRRFPHIDFVTRDVEDPSLPQLGTFDLVLCVGLLYHLENPFRAIRNLHALTGKVLVVESMCIPGMEPELALLDEGHDDNQGLNYIAFYPTESCLVKMLYRSGFPFVYRFKELPSDEQFTDTPSRKRSRTFLAAAKSALSSPNLELARERVRCSVSASDPWTTTFSKARSSLLANLSALKGRLSRLVRTPSEMPVSKSSRHNSHPK